MRARLAAAGLLLAIAWLLAGVRHRFLRDITTWDAAPDDSAPLPDGQGPPLLPAARVRVVLIDGLAADTAATLPAVGALCARGVAMTVDVGFPSVSLPVEIALWTGLTQQQTGIVFRSDRPLEPPLDERGIPAQVPGSHAVAEHHGYIVRSLGFALAEPAAAAEDPARDADPDAWQMRWQAAAHAAVASTSRLVFVHVLEVDTAGHHHGHGSPEYREAATRADTLLASLVADAPDARWFVLSDHGHLDGPRGGHGGEERAIRQVMGCIAGPGIERATGELVHVVDVARALADSTGARLVPSARGRALGVAIAAPLAPDQALPALPLRSAALALMVVVAALLVTLACMRRWLLAPWWYAVAVGCLVVSSGAPTLSMPMIYAPLGLDMAIAWAPALALATIATWFSLERTTLARALAAQLALPFGAVAAAFTACGGWPALLGFEVAPVVPHVTAWTSPLLLLAAHGSAAVALAVLGRTARSAFGRPSPAEPPHSVPADG
jgi:hypothetical protein